VGKHWREYLNENTTKSATKTKKNNEWDNEKIQKIGKSKRSSKGRTTDDWYVWQLLNLPKPTHDSHFSENSSADLRNKILSQKLMRGRVIEVHKRNIFVAEEPEGKELDTGLLWLCSVAKRHFQRSHKERNFVVVGDRVLFQADSAVEFNSNEEPVGTDLPRGVIQHTFERHSQISRQDPLNPEWQHVMLANIDLVCITASVLNPEVRWGLIDRFLVQIEEQKVPVVIVLNKIDLLEKDPQASEQFIAQYRKRVKIYQEIGYEVLEICALKPKKTPDTIKRLKELVKGKLIGLCGHSGVGKSSLINLFKPEFEQIVDENPDIFYKGRHTTTYNSLLKLNSGGYAIDTPGIRSLGLESFEPIFLSSCFPEFRPYKCKYRECSHILEPECGVLEALHNGKISQERYRSYVGLLKGKSFREGDGYELQANEIADLKAREQHRDENPIPNKNFSAEEENFSAEENFKKDAEHE
jgi:ribosome biogenesis GTPase / thiamine phosphate phosphatase